MQKFHPFSAVISASAEKSPMHSSDITHKTQNRIQVILFSLILCINNNYGLSLVQKKKKTHTLHLLTLHLLMKAFNFCKSKNLNSMSFRSLLKKTVSDLNCILWIHFLSISVKFNFHLGYLNISYDSFKFPSQETVMSYLSKGHLKGYLQEIVFSIMSLSVLPA